MENYQEPDTGEITPPNIESTQQRMLVDGVMQVVNVNRLETNGSLSFEIVAPDGEVISKVWIPHKPD